ncbi:hypothetical protein R3W88_000939 [Solanum pinnatisectum]|uniref:Peptidase A2 domain-containing protein n=1 Tax=Solanum pinnatisectum TaxID=50273 RepID=A0AAV9MGT9_9SOLN|nr:hypothetical protein R3W88_000939 [Solanum pinnatisectum]
MYQISNTKIVDFPREVDTPHVQLAIYSSKWDKVVHVHTLIDTGAASSILNQAVLLDDQWISFFQNFSTPSKEILTTKQITKHPVVIEFFSGLQFRTKLLGSAIPRRDHIIGFDIYTQLKDRLEIRAKGIAF